MSGGATVYQQRGFWGSNGAWSVSVAQTNVPYTTRLLVRYPTDRTKFNGTVVFEWLNDTTGGDQDPLWSQIYQQALRDGYAYVGVTAQAAGMHDLAVWDALRYGSLGSSNDGQSYDIFTQAAESVRANSAMLLGGLTPSRLIGAGDSQSAFRIVTYVNAIQPVTHAFDGFLAIGRAAVGAPLGNGLISTSPLPALIRPDNTTPFIQLNTEGDIVELGAGISRQQDNSYLRTWELAGAAHIDAHEASYELATLARDQPTVPIPMCQFGTPITGTGTVLDGINQVNNMPLFEVEDAALVALQKWLSEGIQPPHSPRISTTTFFFVFDVVQRDQYGNALGGIRLPDIQAPTEFYSPINFSQVNPNSLNIDPASLISLVQSTLTTLFVTGSIEQYRPPIIWALPAVWLLHASQQRDPVAAIPVACHIRVAFRGGSGCSRVRGLLDSGGPRRRRSGCSGRAPGMNLPRLQSAIRGPKGGGPLRCRSPTEWLAGWWPKSFDWKHLSPYS